MASSSPMSDHVSCGICMEQYDRTDHVPKLLRCQHTFCLACLLALKRSSSSPSFQCPMCRCKHKGSPHNFTTNRVALDIAEELQQQAYMSLSFESQLASLALSCESQQASPTLSCSAHADVDSVLVCVDCLTGICSKCVKNHRDHQLEDISDAKTLLRARFAEETRKQQSILQTEMASASSVREITRAEDDIKALCTRLISVITKWQNDQLSVIGEIKTKAAKREEEMTAQHAKQEVLLQNDIDISTLIRNLTDKEKISSQPLRGNTYNFVTARETMSADLSSMITSENLVNSKFLQDQTSKAVSVATPQNDSPQQRPTVRGIIVRRGRRGPNVSRNNERRLQEPAYIRRAKLEAVIRDNKQVHIPAHWRKNTELWNPFRVLMLTTDQLLVDVDTRMHTAVERLVKESWVPELVGHGAESVGLGHSDIRVERVQRIEHPNNYQHYSTKLMCACQEVLKCEYPAITSIDNEPKVLTAELNIPELEAIRLREVNEYFLFCGVPKDKLGSAVFRCIGEPVGLYISESSTTADQHADNPTARKPAGVPLYMVVYRVLLGHIYHQKGSTTYLHQPCKDRGCHKKNFCPHSDRYDSVMSTYETDGGVKSNFREFALFDRNRAYPEFLITYKRINTTDAYHFNMPGM